MSIIIATSEGIFADRRTMSDRSGTVYCYNRTKIHELAENIYYAATGTIIHEKNYPAILREIQNFISGEESSVHAFSGQACDFMAFIINGKVYAQYANTDAVELKGRDFYAGGSVAAEAEVLNIIGADPEKIIKLLAYYDKSISSAIDVIKVAPEEQAA